MTKKTWGIFIALCVILIGGLVAYSMKDRVDVSNVDTNKIIAASKSNGQIADHVTGDTKSPVILVEYGDYQCPACGQAYSKIKTITEKYNDQITFIFRNLPLTTIHPNALAAASAAEAAGLQNKYWEMHDLLYTNQNSWSSLTGSDRTSAFVGYAKQLGINIDTFKTDMTGTAVAQKLNFDRAIDAKLGLTGTPSFYLNGEKVSDKIQQDAVSGNAELLDKAIAEALKKHNIEVPTQK